jgi:hypothetical protein
MTFVFETFYASSDETIPMLKIPLRIMFNDLALHDLCSLFFYQGFKSVTHANRPVNGKGVDVLIGSWNTACG